MKTFIKKPVETIVFFILIYEFFFSRQWSGSNFWHKISAIIIASVFFGFIYFIDFTYEGMFKKWYFGILRVLSDAKNKTYHMLYYVLISLLGLFIALIIAGFEYFSETILYSIYPPISIGVPFSIYSFSADKIIFRGIFFNTLLYSIIIKMIFESVKRK